MKQQAVATLMTAMRDLTLVTALTEWILIERADVLIGTPIPADACAALEALEEDLGRSPISPSFCRKLKRLHDRFEGDAGMPSAVAHTLLQEISNDLVTELAEIGWFAVGHTHMELIRANAEAFGPEVPIAFPECANDIVSSTRCLVFGQHTASVFHLMRILESGIHEVARCLDLQLAKGRSEQWKTALDQIEKQIRTLEQLPATAKKNIDTSFYSGIALQFRWFKDAWRNHVIHEPVTYSAIEAWRIWQHVGDTMRELSRQYPNNPVIPAPE